MILIFSMAVGLGVWDFSLALPAGNFVVVVKQTQVSSLSVLVHGVEFFVCFVFEVIQGRFW